MSEPNHTDVVTSCNDCPYWGDTVRADNDCGHPDTGGRMLVDYAEEGNPPERCPLRRGPTLVVLRLSSEAAR